MEKFIRFINQNKKGLIKIIAIIAFFFLILKTVENLIQVDKKGSKTPNIKDNNRPTQSVITGETLSEEQTQKNINIIEKFVTYCNNKEFEKAYLLLTDDCKQEFKNSVDNFKSNYCNKIFKTKKVYNLQLWINETYKITYYEDNLLATGGAGIKDNTEDFITIINENNETKINLNKFIKKEIINKSKTVNNIELIVNSRNIYKDYETYNITLKNNTTNIITINDGETPENTTIVDQNNLEYLSFIEEIPEYQLKVEKMQQRTLDIRFNKIYDIYRRIEKIKFSGINLGNEINQEVEIIIDI